jgi:predicted phosphoribosyltransferase
MPILFEDRIDAGLQLVTRLREYEGRNAVVVAVPRGGVPIGAVVARKLGLPMDVALIKKLGHPFNREYAIGAVSLTGLAVDDESGISPEYIASEVRRIRALLRERYHTYSGNLNPVELAGKTVILIDDGIATGKTLRAAIDLIRQQAPLSIVLAVPVAAGDSLRALEKLVDRVICLYTPQNFQAVGQSYRVFDQVSDEEVVRWLKQVHTEPTHTRGLSK